MTAAAVWFPDMRIPQGVDDSKMIPENRRDDLAHAIRQHALVSIGHASVAEIDRLGILRATHVAMARAWTMLPAPRDALVIIDGQHRPDGIDAEIRCVPGADGSCPSVAAASLVAKVDRDQAMRVLAGEDDPYGWRQNKGYGVPYHRMALERHGASPLHRRSFAPVARAIRNRDKG